MDGRQQISETDNSNFFWFSAKLSHTRAYPSKLPTWPGIFGQTIRDPSIPSPSAPARAVSPLEQDLIPGCAWLWSHLAEPGAVTEKHPGEWRLRGRQGPNGSRVRVNHRKSRKFWDLVVVARALELQCMITWYYMKCPRKLHRSLGCVFTIHHQHCWLQIPIGTFEISCS